MLTRVELDVKLLDINQCDSGHFEFSVIAVNFENASKNIIVLYNRYGPFETEELDHYASTVNGKKLLCGDFNEKHSDWDSNGSNTAGRYLNNFIMMPDSLSLIAPPDLGTRYN